MIAPSHCTQCGGTHLSEKTIEKAVRGGNHTAYVTLSVVACLDCGERFLDPDAIERLEGIRKRLERGETSGLKPIGQAFQAA